MSDSKLRLPLFFTRISIAYFLLPWILMRFTQPDSAEGIAAKYYKISSMPDIATTIIGVLWLILLACFVLGIKKRISYGLVLVLHAIGTAFTIPYLLLGTSGMNILFFAAIPVIGAMWLLYTLRDQDTLLSLNK